MEPGNESTSDGFFEGKCISEYSGGLDSDDVGTASEPVVQCCRPYVYWKDSGSRGNSTAGVVICFPLITMITAFTYLFGNGGSPLCAMELGRGNHEEAEKLMGNTFSMLLISSIILMAVSYLFYKPILYAFGASDVTFPYAGDYITIYLIGTPFVMISLGLNPFINCQGFGNMGMLMVLIGAVLNIILDPNFYFWIAYGSKRCCTCNDYFPDLFRNMGVKISYRKESHTASESPGNGNRMGTGKRDYGTWNFGFYDAVYEWAGTDIL